jgi:hypothetical protein
MFLDLVTSDVVQMGVVQVVDVTVADEAGVVGHGT